MTQQPHEIPLFPPLGARLLRSLPMRPLSFLFGHAARGMAGRHTESFARLGSHADKRFLIDPTDLEITFLVRPRLADPKVDIFRRSSTPDWDARIAGPLAALLGMIHGAFDGDALFFSRDVVIEGDTEAALALRNALDDAEVDLIDEMVRSLGVPGRVLGPGLRSLAELTGQITGVALTRQELRQ